MSGQSSPSSPEGTASEVRDAHTASLVCAAVYSIFTSPHHPPVPDHLPTLIVTPNGRPNQVLCERASQARAGRGSEDPRFPLVFVGRLLTLEAISGRYISTHGNIRSLEVRSDAVLTELRVQAHNTENYLLTPSDAGDLCVAKLYPPDSSGSLRAASTSANGAASSLGHGSALGAAMGGSHIRCEASRGLNWRIHQTGIQVRR